MQKVWQVYIKAAPIIPMKDKVWYTIGVNPIAPLPDQSCSNQQLHHDKFLLFFKVAWSNSKRVAEFLFSCFFMAWILLCENIQSGKRVCEPGTWITFWQHFHVHLEKFVCPQMHETIIGNVNVGPYWSVIFWNFLTATVDWYSQSKSQCHFVPKRKCNVSIQICSPCTSPIELHVWSWYLVPIIFFILFVPTCLRLMTSCIAWWEYSVT